MKRLLLNVIDIMVNIELYGKSFSSRQPIIVVTCINYYLIAISGNNMELEEQKINPTHEGEISTNLVCLI